MHEEARQSGLRFFEKYCKDNIETKKILDVGSYDVNGTLKPIFERGEYVGLDMMAGPNVDIVSKAHDIDLPDESFDIILSTSCFEHDDMFWVTFLEMCRIVKPGGFIYTCQPKEGPYHAHPGDNWRFYEDAGAALAKWAHRSNYKNIKLIETYITKGSYWVDNTIIWGKEKA